MALCVTFFHAPCNATKWRRDRTDRIECENEKKKAVHTTDRLRAVSRSAHITFYYAVDRFQSITRLICVSYCIDCTVKRARTRNGTQLICKVRSEKTGHRDRRTEVATSVFAGFRANGPAATCDWSFVVATVYPVIGRDSGRTRRVIEPND